MKKKPIIIVSSVLLVLLLLGVMIRFLPKKYRINYSIPQTSYKVNDTLLLTTTNEYLLGAPFRDDQYGFAPFGRLVAEDGSLYPITKMVSSTPSSKKWAFPGASCSRTYSFVFTDDMPRGSYDLYLFTMDHVTEELFEDILTLED